MPFEKEFTYNPSAKYVLEYYNDKFKFNKYSFYVNQKDNFTVDLINVFTEYPLTFTTEEEFNVWRANSNIKYWQNQLNFAVYCATYGCGVSVYDHMVSFTNPIVVTSFFQFHFYYQVRKILTEMKCAIPTNQNFNRMNNYIDMTEYTKIANEFDIDPNADFRLKLGPNDGAGYVYTDDKKINDRYDSNVHSFEHPTGYVVRSAFGTQYGEKYYHGFEKGYLNHVTKIAQDIDDGWTRFMLKKSNGFTKAGIARINDSIRTYVYCMLGAQVQARTAIIGQSGTSPDAQKQFIKNLYDSIYADLAIPDSIERYQNAVNNSHVKLDFAIGSGLYMIPSDLVMKIGSLDNYNNNILIATDNMAFGVNNINNQLLHTVPQTVPVVEIISQPVLAPVSSFKPEPLKTEPLKPEAFGPARAKPEILYSNTPQTKITDTYQESKYVLPLILGLSAGLFAYFIK